MMTEGERLYAIEEELDDISTEQHRLARRKTGLVEDATRLRVSLTHGERLIYEQLKRLGAVPVDRFLRRLGFTPVDEKRRA